MSKLGRALLGGLAGGFEALSDLSEQGMEEKREQKKLAVAEKRARNLARLQHDYDLERQAIGHGQQLEKMTEQERLNKLKEARDVATETMLLEKEYGFKEKLEKTKQSKIKTKAEKDLRKDAYDEVNAFILSQGGYQGADVERKDKNSYVIDLEGKSQQEVGQILATIDQSGFQIQSRQEPESNELQIFLGSFDANKYKAIKVPYIYAGEEINQDDKVDEDKKLTSSSSSISDLINKRIQQMNNKKEIKTSGIMSPEIYRDLPEYNIMQP